MNKRYVVLMALGAVLIVAGVAGMFCMESGNVRYAVFLALAGAVLCLVAVGQAVRAGFSTGGFNLEVSDVLSPSEGPKVSQERDTPKDSEEPKVSDPSSEPDSSHPAEPSACSGPNCSGEGEEKKGTRGPSQVPPVLAS